MVRGMAEPSDVLRDESRDVPPLIVVEANKYQLIRLPLPKNALEVDGGVSRRSTPQIVMAGLLQAARPLLSVVTRGSEATPGRWTGRGPLAHLALVAAACCSAAHQNGCSDPQ